MKVKVPVGTLNTGDKAPIRKLNTMETFLVTIDPFSLTFSRFYFSSTDSDNILNGNTPPIASQKAFNIIADSLRRIDVSQSHRCI